jgi:hypothetical protein
MSPSRYTLFLFVSFLACSAASAQQPAPVPAAPQRDPQAVAVLVGAFKTLGGNLPADSVATGNIQIVAGSRTEVGTIRILTRGFDQTVEDIQTAQTHKSLVYSKGLATQIHGYTAKPLQLELAVTSQSPNAPIAFIAGALNNPNVGMAYLGLEDMDGTSVHHLRIWTTFPSNLELAHLADFSVRHLWLDAATGLPLKVAYVSRAARGSTPANQIEVLFSDYRSINGVRIPYRIEDSLNGTPRTTIAITSVAFNQNLTDADFPIAKGGIQ